jgi:predicted amino acid-binding ACT domain protein
MTDTSKEVNLHDTTDASIWATEFCKNWTTALCQIPGKEGVETESDFQDIMLGWFANAIMAGVDSEARKTASERDALASDNAKLKERVAINEEYAVDTIEEIIGETHDIDVTDRMYAQNIVNWLKRHHPAALLAIAEGESHE